MKPEQQSIATDCPATPYSPPPFDPPKGSFQKEFEHLINCKSIEGGSDTPDFILAEYLTDCLRAWNRATKRREDWYGRTPQEVSPPSSTCQP